MAGSHEDIASSQFFGRLLTSFRRLIGQDKQAANTELAALTSLIEDEIIPRLQMTFPTSQSGDFTASNDGKRPEYDTQGFVTALLSEEPDNARQFVHDLVESGHSLSEIYQHLLTPSARHLGKLWEDDECSFAGVTIAITKIRHIFISTAPPFPVHMADDDDDPPSILLTTVPGEQHTFGLYLVVELFREAGWCVWSGTPRSTQELSDLVAREHYDVVGLSVVAKRNVAAVSRAIHNIRQQAKNPDLKILLGGRIAATNPELLANIGADRIVTDTDNLAELTRAMLSRGLKA